MEHIVLRKLRRLAQDYQMLPPGGLILAAVSGGADSMCLLHALLTLGESHPITVAAAHFNHQLRSQAPADETFVRDWCAAHSVPFYSTSADVAAQATAAGKGIEETARTLRYAFLEATASEIGAARIATAHHADDNTETLLLHLIRGSGRKGLGGIPPVRDGNLIRPLLTAERWEIEDYLRCYGIPHVEDETNRDTTYTRNYLRQEVVPRLKTLNPKLNVRLWECACQFRQEDAYLDSQAQVMLTEMTRLPNGVSLPCAQVTQLPEALSLRGIQLLAEALDPTLILSAAHRRGILELCQHASPSGQVDLPGNCRARRTYDRLELIQDTKPKPAFAPITLMVPGITLVAGWRFTCERGLCPAGKYNQPRDFYLRLPAHARLTLRPRRVGDAITLPTRDRKTIKKLLIDAKVPRRLRDSLPVFDWEGTVCALTEFGADQAFLPRPGDVAWHISAVPISIH